MGKFQQHRERENGLPEKNNIAGTKLSVHNIYQNFMKNRINAIKLQTKLTGFFSAT